MTHPPIPPAVAEWLAERLAAEQKAADLSPIRSRMALADRLIVEAEAAGIEVSTVDLYSPGADYAVLRLSALDASLTPALAVELGLTGRRTQPYRDTDESIESFRGEVDGTSVIVQHTIPTAVLTAEQVAS